MRCLHYPICITRNWSPSVDAGLTDIVRIGLWPCPLLYCLQWLPIHWLRVTASESLTNYRIYKTKNLWGSIDTQFQNGEVNVLLALLLIKAANMLVTHNSKYIPFQLPYLHYQNALTLCWCSFSGAVTSTLTILPTKAANTWIMGKCCSTALGLYKMQHPNSLTLGWRSFPEWGRDHVAFSFAHKGCQNVDYGQMP